MLMQKVEFGKAIGAAIAAVFLFSPIPVNAQAAKTFGDSLAIPVFEQVDQNGVDLINGMLRVSSPTLTSGTDEKKRIAGLQWTGQSWSYIGYPTLWKDGNKFIVNYNGRSEEFRDRHGGYAQQKPITGAEFGCSIFEPENLTAWCIYTNREGDVVAFRGPPVPTVPIPEDLGIAGFRFGNIGMVGARVYSQDIGTRDYGDLYNYGSFPELNKYFKRDYDIYLSGRFIKVTTPNHDDDTDEHYLRPKGTVQTFTDQAGSEWKYSINSDRELIFIDTPGTTGDVSFLYDNDHRVTRVTTAAGIWNYSYTRSGDNGTTTVLDPLGNETIVKYNHDKGYITDVRDPLLRWTRYQYDAGYRLIRITYPELNYVAIEYDTRGNVIRRTTHGKPFPSPYVLPIYETASFLPSCDLSPICNKPISRTDANGAITEFTYYTPTPQTIWPEGTGSGYSVTALAGSGRPKTITSPAPTTGAPRPQVSNVYVSGVLVESSFCKTQSSCTGTADEVKTTYDYGGTEGLTRRMFGMAVTANGETLRTCYGYDTLGRRISETPPRANLSSCPHTVTPAPPASTEPPAVGDPPPGGGDPNDPPFDPNDPCGGEVCQ